MTDTAKSPRQKEILSARDEEILRGATLLRDLTRTLRDTNISPETDVFPHVAEYSDPSPEPLTAPSAVHLTDCSSARFSASRALCGIMPAVISASTVSMVLLFNISVGELSRTFLYQGPALIRLPSTGRAGKAGPKAVTNPASMIGPFLSLYQRSKESSPRSSSDVSAAFTLLRKSEERGRPAVYQERCFRISRTATLSPLYSTISAM